MTSLKKNYIIQAWLVLLLCLFFGSSLAGIQLTLAPKIFENKKNETLKKIPDLVFGESQSKNDKASGKEININSFLINSEKNGKKKLYNVYEVKDENGQKLGFVSKSSGQGYADKIEILVNDRIRDNFPVQIQEMDAEKAFETGATALFEEKYGDKVRVVSISDFSKELCGGTHIGRTGDIGLFKIVEESSVASGVRRIEAVTGSAAVEYIQKEANIIRKICCL